jgi:hypothetical protein
MWMIEFILKHDFQMIESFLSNLVTKITWRHEINTTIKP